MTIICLYEQKLASNLSRIRKGLFFLFGSRRISVDLFIIFFCSPIKII